MYGMASGASVSDLFLAGIVPGLMIGLLLMLYAIYHCKRYGEDREKIYAEVKTLHDKGLLRVLRESFFALLSPVIILGCIYSGVASPDRGGCYLRILCIDHQPFCVQEYPHPRHLVHSG